MLDILNHIKHWLTLPGWTISWWPLRLYCMCISFWKLSWNTRHVEEVRRDSQRRKRSIRRELLTPCFMISLAWLATSFTMLRAATRKTQTLKRKQISFFLYASDNKHSRGASDLVCLCNLLILLEGSSDNLKNGKSSKTSFMSAVLYVRTFVGQCLEHTHFSLYFIQQKKRKKWRVNGNNLKRPHCWSCQNWNYVIRAHALAIKQLEGFINSWSPR